MPTLSVSFPVPYVCQFASPDLVWEFVNKQRDPASDPCWAEYGAATPQEYAYWALRSCGVVCIKMAVEGLMRLPPRPIMEWVREGLAIDGYLTEIRKDRPVEIGWKHSALAEIARRHGCRADLAAGLTGESIADHLRADHLVITSVTSELGEDAPITRQHGHLVVVHGTQLDGAGRVEAIIAHNPSGRCLEMQAGAVIPLDRFIQGFSGRGIIVGPPTDL